MRATLIASAIALAVFAFAAPAYGGACDALTNCTACLDHADCGWCSDWSGCTEGSSRPWKGTCKMWHEYSCTGVTNPSMNKCVGPPISRQRVRQLIGPGNSFVTLVRNVRWTDQSRKCNSVTGCTDWTESRSAPPRSDISLLAKFGTVYLNIMTGNCTEKTCASGGYELPLFDSRLKDDADQFTQIGIQSSQVGESSLAFNHNSIPFYRCNDRKCSAYAWTGAGGQSQFVLTATLTDNCLLIASDYSSGSSSDPDVDYVEFYAIF